MPKATHLGQGQSEDVALLCLPAGSLLSASPALARSSRLGKLQNSATPPPPRPHGRYPAILLARGGPALFPLLAIVLQKMKSFHRALQVFLDLVVPKA